MTDREHVDSLAERWRQRRAWAESLLLDRLQLDDLRDIFRLGRAVERDVPGTEWKYKTHGIGVRVYRPDEMGGIDFDLDKPDPDGWRLHDFARRQVEDGELSEEVYERVFADDRRLERVLAGRSTDRAP